MQGAHLSVVSPPTLAVALLLSAAALRLWRGGERQALRHFPIVDGDTMRRVDLAVAAKLKVIRTYECVALRVADFCAYQLRVARTRHLIFVCGPGNNGHNAITAARMLLLRAYRVSVLLSVAEPSQLSQLPREQLELFVAFGGTVIDALPAACEDEVLVIDGLLGHGITSAPRGRVGELVSAINAAPHEVLSIDIPSGINHATGACYEPCVRATHTLTLHVPKSGVVAACATAHVGALWVAETCLTFTEWGETVNLGLIELFADKAFARLR